jgi:DNA-directed RNA polymerase sigma subunit (sigma70/sigma32)
MHLRSALRQLNNLCAHSWDVLMEQWFSNYLDQLRTYAEFDDSWFPGSLERARNGDVQARERIVGSALRLVADVALEHERRVDAVLIDLVEEGNTVILLAFDSFIGSSSVDFGNHLTDLVTRHWDVVFQGKGKRSENGTEEECGV